MAVYSPNTIELFAILFACEQAGAINVPLNWRLSQFELQALLEDCSPALLIYHEHFSSSAQMLRVENKRSLSSADQVEIQNLQIAYAEIKSNTDPWMVIYTGGTTGLPKGVVLSYKAVNANALNTIASWGLTERDTTINYMPLFHTGGLNALSIPILMAGGTVVVGHQFDPVEAMQATNKYGATISLFVPTMYQMMIQTPCFAEVTFPSMNVFVSGGASCPMQVYEAFLNKGLRFKEGYGLTEAGPNNFAIRPEEEVIGVQDERWGEKVIACIADGGESMEDKDLLVLCSDYLASYKLPKEFIRMDELPKTHVGKIDKNALQEKYAEEVKAKG